ncbi:MAG: LLM class flavin-dependent oxidoreductase [Acidimicrobiia bacterium]|nr:LLM class flavin-dependent oxidoreductase [Acidimicrobiia bacterium]
MRFYILQIPYLARASELAALARARAEAPGQRVPPVDPKQLVGASRERFAVMLAEMTDQVRLAEQLGYHGVCWTEQHFQAEGVEVNTNPVLYGAHMIANTTTMRVGQLGIPLPCHNPLQVAEDLALLDHMAQGRTFVGFSRGNTPRYMNTLGQKLGSVAATSDKSASDEFNRELMKESWLIIKKAWTEPLVAHRGAVWQVPPPGIPLEFPPSLDVGGVGSDAGELTAVTVVPRPFQEPHPPLYTVFSFSMTTARFWAEQGATLVSFVDNPDFWRTTLGVYRDHAARAGFTDVPPGRALAAGGHLVTQRSAARAERYAEEFRWLFEYAYNCPPYNVPVGRLFGGTGRDAYEQVARLHDELGVDEVFLWHHVNCFDRDAEREALEEFGEHVVARLRD